jgi:hypothetical protein
MYIIMNVMSINLQLVEAFYAEEIGVGHALLTRQPATRSPGTGTRQLIQRGSRRCKAITRQRGPNQMKAITPSKSIKKMMAVRDSHHDLVPRSILDGGSRP